MKNLQNCEHEDLILAMERIKCAADVLFIFSPDEFNADMVGDCGCLIQDACDSVTKIIGTYDEFCGDAPKKSQAAQVMQHLKQP